MSEQFIEPDTERFSLSEMCRKRDELKKRIEKHPDDWTAKHLLQSYIDEIKLRREELYNKEQKRLLES